MRHAAKGTLCLHIAAALGAIYKDDQFAALFPRRGQPAEAPGRLALATVLQYVEGLQWSDGRQLRQTPVLGQEEATRSVSQTPLDSDPAVTCQAIISVGAWAVTF